MLLRRRDVLRSGLAASVLGILPPGITLAADAKPDAGQRLFLFVDWFHVKKGDLHVTLDPKRVHARGREQLDALARDFNKVFERGEHGFKGVDVPSGVRIVPERAERSQPWLVADQPWES